MSDEKEKTYIEFVRRVTMLGRELQITPFEALFLFGSIARGIVNTFHARGDGRYDEMAARALGRFASGFGDADAGNGADGGLH